jgi:hypothetical protein
VVLSRRVLVGDGGLSLEHRVLLVAVYYRTNLTLRQVAPVPLEQSSLHVKPGSHTDPGCLKT